MITKKIFNDLAIYMMGFGCFIGIAFPFFLILTGVPSDIVLTPIFFIICMGAGLTVGLVNIFLAKRIVGRKLKQLSTHMGYVEDKLKDKTSDYEIDKCSEEKCFFKIDSEDEIGECAKAFNALVSSLSSAFLSQKEIRTFTEILSSQLELEKLADKALVAMMDNLNTESGVIIIEKEGELTVISSHCIKTPESILENDILWKVIRDKKRYIVELPENIIVESLIVEFKPKFIMVEPILYKDIIIGVVILAGIHTFTDVMQRNMDQFSKGLALALRNAITYGQLQTLATVDPLTGVFNRRFGLTRLKEEFSNAVRYSLPIGVLMVDIDHFKRVNDNYGHPVGDKILLRVARTAKLALREGDVLFRYGGEEFMIVLPGASLADVQKIAERLRHMIQDMNIQHNLQEIKITVSIGGTSFPEIEVANYDALISIADEKLYEAKESGRNKSIISLP